MSATSPCHQVSDFVAPCQHASVKQACRLSCLGSVVHAAVAQSWLLKLPRCKLATLSLAHHAALPASRHRAQGSDTQRLKVVQGLVLHAYDAA